MLMPPLWQAVSPFRCSLPMVTTLTYAQPPAGSYDSTVKLWDIRCVCQLFSYARSRLTLGTESISSQNRQPIQALEEARDSIQALYVGSSRIMSGSVDGHVRTYDLRKGELRADYIGRTCATDIPKRLSFSPTRFLFCLQIPSHPSSPPKMNRRIS